MSQNKQYNGWANYETWAVKLWIDNEEPSYRHALSLATEHYSDASADKTFSRSERARFGLADALKEMLEDGNPLTGEASVYSDLLSAALSEVNWDEIAEAYIEEVQEEIDLEEQEDEDEDEDSEGESPEDEFPADSGEEN